MKIGQIINRKIRMLSVCVVLTVPLLSQLQTAAKFDVAKPPYGILVDAGGHKLHLSVQGNGSPTVIFENGTADFSFIWSLVQPDVAKFTRTVSYDRAGYAWSDPGPTPRTSKQICYELHTALQHAGINPPYILVGQSFGGFLVRAFARYYPGEVVGVVLVEAVQEDQRIFMGGDTPMLIRSFARGRTVPDVQTVFTIPHDTSEPITSNTEIDPLFNKFPDSIQKMQVWAQSQPWLIPSVQAEMDWSPEDVADLYAHRNDPAYMLGDMPLIVLTRGEGGFDGRSDSLQLENERLHAQHELTHLSTNSKQIIDMHSGHNIHVEDPAVVTAAINEVFTAATTNTTLKQ
ncbi:MAG TPA: alpha/beta hydrolase [Parafilimonas sp.]|nr:alpha/beta hydrolase [Parafilimonas sp.]